MSDRNPFCHLLWGYSIFTCDQKQLSRFIDTGYDALRCAAVPHGVNVR